MPFTKRRGRKVSKRKSSKVGRKRRTRFPRKKRSMGGVNNRSILRRFTIERLVSNANAPASDIYLSATSYLTTIPPRGAQGFQLGDIPAVERNAFEAIYQQCALTKVITKFYPSVTQNAQIRNIDPISGDVFYWSRMQSVFCSDQEDAVLEDRTDIMNHGYKKIYAHGTKPMTITIVPRTKNAIFTVAGSTIGSVNNELQWFSTHTNDYESVAHYGYKWSVGTNNRVQVPDNNAQEYGRMVYHYYVRYRRAKMISVADEGGGAPGTEDPGA